MVSLAIQFGRDWFRASSPVLRLEKFCSLIAGHVGGNVKH
jgi:hypothetical protein